MESHKMRQPHVDRITKEKIEGLAGALDDSLEDVYVRSPYHVIAVRVTGSCVRQGRRGVTKVVFLLTAAARVQTSGLALVTC